MRQFRGRVIRVFVSSTFDDLEAERNLLQSRVFPRIRERCKASGWDFQPVDLRWGIGNEASSDNRTMAICLAELRHCQRYSPRPNFLILLGERYGWRPLPEAIPEPLGQAIRAEMSTDLLRCFDEWYRLDTNQLPEPVFTLQPLPIEYCTSGNEPDWQTYRENVERPLGLFFRDFAARHATADPPAQVQGNAALGDATPFFGLDRSATEQEILKGAFEVPDAADHVIACMRTLRGVPDDSAGAKYQDSDADDCARLTSLKERLAELLPEDSICRYTLPWQEVVGGSLSELHAFGVAVEERLMRIVDREVEAHPALDPLLEEQRHHTEFRQQRAEGFHGRTEELDAISAYVRGDISFPLFIHGPSGSGKSALVGRSVEVLHNEPNLQRACIVERFVGASPRSVSLERLIRGVCEEIARHCGLEIRDDAGLSWSEKHRVQDDPKVVLVSEHSDRLSDCFARALKKFNAEGPLIVFLDGLEQLDAQDHLLSFLWLPKELPKQVKIIVSCAADDGLLQSIRARWSAVRPIMLPEMEAPDGLVLFDEWMQTAGRRLSGTQRRAVEEKLTRPRTPLYLKLLFEEACTWKSYEHKGAPPALPDTVDDLVGRLLDGLSTERGHDPQLVACVMTYLYCARRGLTHGEMLGVLAADDSFWRRFLVDAHHKPPGVDNEEWEQAHRMGTDAPPETGAEADCGYTKNRRLPPILWARLHYDLEPYLSRREVPGGTVVGLAHRQFLRVIEERYLKEATPAAIHKHFAGYFGSRRWYRTDTPWCELTDETKLRVVNIRKADEFFWHLRHCGARAEAEAQFTTFEAIEAKVYSGLCHDLVDDIRLFLAAAEPEANHTRLRLLGQALRRNVDVLKRSPSLLFSRLWDLYQGYKSQHRGESDGFSALMQCWYKEHEAKGLPTHCLVSELPSYPLLGEDEFRFTVSTSKLRSIALTRIAGRPLVVTRDFLDTCLLLDAQTGKEVASIGAVQCLAVSHDTQYLISAYGEDAFIWTKGEGSYSLTKEVRLVRREEAPNPEACSVLFRQVRLSPNDQHVAFQYDVIEADQKRAFSLLSVFHLKDLLEHPALPSALLRVGGVSIVPGFAFGSENDVYFAKGQGPDCAFFHASLAGLGPTPSVERQIGAGCALAIRLEAFGQRVFFAEGTSIVVLDAASGKRVFRDFADDLEEFGVNWPQEQKETLQAQLWLSSGGQYLAVCFAHFLLVYSVNSDSLALTQMVLADDSIACVAVDDEEGLVVYGCEKGEICGVRLTPHGVNGAPAELTVNHLPAFGTGNRISLHKHGDVPISITSGVNSYLIEHLCVSADGEYLCLVYNNNIQRVLSTRTWKLLRQLEFRDVVEARFAKDADYLCLRLGQIPELKFDSEVVGAECSQGGQVSPWLCVSWKTEGYECHGSVGSFAGDSPMGLLDDVFVVRKATPGTAQTIVAGRFSVLQADPLSVCCLSDETDVSNVLEGFESLVSCEDSWWENQLSLANKIENGNLSFSRAELQVGVVSGMIVPLAGFWLGGGNHLARSTADANGNRIGFPVALSHLVKIPGRNVWAGAEGRNLRVFALHTISDRPARAGAQSDYHSLRGSLSGGRGLASTQTSIRPWGGSAGVSAPTFGAESISSGGAPLGIRVWDSVLASLGKWIGRLPKWTLIPMIGLAGVGCSLGGFYLGPAFVATVVGIVGGAIVVLHIVSSD